MVTVKIRDDESLEQALRRFNREVLREGIIRELRKREFYEKPSQRKRREKEQARRRETRRRKEAE